MNITNFENTYSLIRKILINTRTNSKFQFIRNALCMGIMIFLISLKSAAQEKPNILFIYSDDQAFNTIGNLNNPIIKTPNLDNLVSQGTSFTHAFNQGGWQGAICVASRSMLNTGTFIWQAEEHNARANSQVSQTNEQPLDYWSVLLKNSGYTTYMTGKWHLRKKVREIFDQSKNIRPGMPNQTQIRYARTFEAGVPDTWSPYDKTLEGFWKGGTHWSQVVADNAIEFLDQAKNDAAPFFMYLAFNAPHDPRQSPKEFVDMYPWERIDLPQSFIGEYPYSVAAASGRTLRDERLAPFPRTERSVKINLQEYYASISYMDEQIGRILKALELSGKAENTYIIFTSDHGLAVGDHGFMGKQNMYDPSMRVPLILTGPKIPKQKIIDELVYLQDVMPTTLNLAQAEIPEHVDFNSLLPLINEENMKGYEAIYGAYIKNQRMIRTKDYKMIMYPTIQKVRLYDIKNDPFELNDLSDDKNYNDKIAHLFLNFLKLQQETGDKLDVSPILEKYLIKQKN